MGVCWGVAGVPDLHAPAAALGQVLVGADQDAKDAMLAAASAAVVAPGTHADTATEVVPDGAADGGAGIQEVAASQ